MPRATRKKRRMLNVLGKPLVSCSMNPVTGYFRNGYCSTGPSDTGTHVVCAVVTDAFLQFSKLQGNDLISPAPGFPGLKAGDKWCLCAHRWKEAYDADVAPSVVLESTNRAVLRIVPLKILKQFRFSTPIV
jgi:uncharacterized protein (DUF2237 family)